MLEINEVLARNYFSSKDLAEKEQILQQITNNAVLCAIVITEKDKKLRQMAIMQMNDSKYITRAIEIGKNTNKENSMLLTRIQDEETFINILYLPQERDIDFEVLHYIKNQVVLMEVALDCPKRYLRKEAADMVTSQDLIAEIIIKTDDISIRKMLVKKITDQDILVMLMCVGIEEVQVLLIEKITAQDFLQLITLNEEYSDTIRQIALAKVKSQKVIYIIAVTTKGAIQYQAATMLTDEELIKNVICNINNQMLQLVLLEKVSKKVYLREIIISVKKAKVVSRAAKLIEAKEQFVNVRKDKKYTMQEIIGISNQEELGRIVLSDNYSYNEKYAALHRIRNQKVLANILMHNVDAYIVFRAKTMLKNEDLIIRVILNTENEELQLALVSKLTSQTLLFKVASEAYSADVKEKAINMLTSETKLYRLLYNIYNVDLQYIIAERITSQEMLRKIALSYNVRAIRNIAICKLVSEDDLAEVLVHDEDENCATTALFRIINRTKLQKVTENIRLNKIRNMAYAKMAN